MAYDSRVSDLFTSSLGSVKPTTSFKARILPSDEAEENLKRPLGGSTHGTVSTTYSNNVSERIGGGNISDDGPTSPALPLDEDTAPRRRRKRKKDEDDIEGAYMQRMADEKSRDVGRRMSRDSHKRQRLVDVSKASDRGTDTDNRVWESPDVETTKREIGDHSGSPVPQHESLTSSRQKMELEKAARTVFLANVPTLCIKSKTAKKTLLGHLTSFCPLIAAADTSHKIESLRFRSTPFASGVGPKKAAYAKTKLMDATTKSTNAYVVYTTPLAAREAVKRLNGTIVLDRHLLVDGVAHPRKTDHWRCVFVGNLGFVDDESQIDAAKSEKEDKKLRKSREPADVEEGLWRQFSKAGQIESVRVVRDATTRVGKGFAYVQFQNANAVEKALLYSDKKFPPLLPRTLRVTRAKKMTKTASHKSQHSNRIVGAKMSMSSANKYTPKTDPVAKSMSGRAGKLFGRAGAAESRARAEAHGNPSIKGRGNVPKAPEQVVFEGYRASSKQSKGAKLGGSGKRQGKPQTRSSRRGAAFKAKGGKKAGTRA